MIDNETSSTLRVLRAEVAVLKLLIDTVVAHFPVADRESILSAFSHRLERMESAVEPIRLAPQLGQAMVELGVQHVGRIRSLADTRRS